MLASVYAATTVTRKRRAALDRGRNQSQPAAVRNAVTMPVTEKTRPTRRLIDDASEQPSPSSTFRWLGPGCDLLGGGGRRGRFVATFRRRLGFAARLRVLAA